MAGADRKDPTIDMLRHRTTIGIQNQHDNRRGIKHALGEFLLLFNNFFCPLALGDITEYTLQYSLASNFKQTGRNCNIFDFSGLGNDLRFQNLALFFCDMLLESTAKSSLNVFRRMENPLVLTNEF